MMNLPGAQQLIRRVVPNVLSSIELLSIVLFCGSFIAFIGLSGVAFFYFIGSSASSVFLFDGQANSVRIRTRNTIVFENIPSVLCGTSIDEESPFTEAVRTPLDAQCLPSEETIKALYVRSLTVPAHSTLHIRAAKSGFLEILVESENSLIVVNAREEVEIGFQQIRFLYVTRDGTSKNLTTINDSIFVLPFSATELAIDNPIEGIVSRYPPRMNQATVLLLERTLVSNELFVAKEQRLGIGDQLTFIFNDEAEAFYVGYVSSSFGEWIDIGFRVAANQVEVNRMYSEGYILTSSFFDRFLSDSISAYIAFFLSIFMSTGFVSFVVSRSTEGWRGRSDI